MNYYNPYFSMMPYNYTPTLASSASALTKTASSRGLLSSLFGGGKLSAFINGTQKTLGIINQAIPLVKQVTPVMKNAKTMFKVMNEFKRVDKPTPTINNATNTSNNNAVDEEVKVEENVSSINTSNNGPTFFL